MISDQLNKKTISITGSTGFLGTALVERILWAAPEAKLVLLIRSNRRFDAATRLHRDILKNDCFDRLRARHGNNFESFINNQISVVDGDVSSLHLGLKDDDLKRFSNVDVVIHSAASVSFDSPINSAVSINLLGPSNVNEAIKSCGSKAHLIAVSTAYVAGERRGLAYEELVTQSWYTPQVDWRAEVTEATRAINDVEHESRTDKMLLAFNRESRLELGGAGKPLVAEKSEKKRQAWVKQKMIDIGSSRARSLGWPDVYAYTKALGEQALIEQKGDTPISIVRPSIIESALSEPHPGWIRGFRMAEPILLGVGKGLLKSFPGLPEGVLDVITVDKVVALLCAVAASEPPSEPKVYQMASGTTQPLRYRDLVDLVTDYYRKHPIYDSDNLPIPVSNWNYPQRKEVETKLKAAHGALKYARIALRVLPLRQSVSRLGSKVDEKFNEVDRALSYVRIYCPYTESEARFSIDNSIALYKSLDATDRSKFNFDPSDIDWKHYLHDIHLPSVIAQGRVKTAPSKTVVVDRSARVLKDVLSNKVELAVFDLEHTLIPSTVVGAYLHFASRGVSPLEKAKVHLDLAIRAPGLYIADRNDRSEFQRRFYRLYRGVNEHVLRERGNEIYDEFVAKKISKQGLERLIKHRELGHRTLLITGTLRYFLGDLVNYFDDVIATDLVIENGVATGELMQSPPVGESRALLLRDYCRGNFDLSKAVAYADATADLPMLEAVGYPIAVNADARLSAIANSRGWRTEHWLFNSSRNNSRDLDNAQ